MMKKQSTTFYIVAHRISAKKFRLNSLFRKTGNKRKKGTYEELLELRGAYYDIYCEQFKDFNLLEEEVI